MDTVIFAAGLVANVFIGVSLSDCNIVKLLIIVPLFNANTKYILTHFVHDMAAIVRKIGSTKRRHYREQTAYDPSKRLFSSSVNLFGMPEENVIRTYCLPG